MMKKLVIVLAVMACVASVFAWERPQKKLIGFGWMMPRYMDQFKATVEEFERNSPFDGIGFNPLIHVIRDGRDIEYNMPFNMADSKIVLTKEDYAEFISLMKSLKLKNLKYNFLTLNSAQFSPDWFDDASWAKTMQNYRTIVWVAKEIGFMGIAFDTEGYGHTGRPFSFYPQKGHSFAETEAKVRERASDWIRQIADIYPDITIFCYIWAGDFIGRFQARGHEHIIGESLSLQYAFMNGVYDALPDTVKLIDGNEDPGYKAATSAHMDKCVSDYYFNAKRWIDAKNLPKFYRSTSLSCSLYLDSYMPDNPHPYQLWKTTDNQARLLQDNVTHILEHSDEYAWIWGEKGTFFPQLYPTHRFKYWNERLPMTREAIEAGKDPYGTAKKYAGENLLQNSELNSGVVANDGNTPADNKGLLPHWASWIDPKTGGKIRPVNGTVCFSGTSNACIIQYYTGAESNTRYLLTARCKLDSTCTVPTLGVNFYDAEKKGIWSLTQRAVFSEPDGDGWRTGELLFDSPDFPMAYMGLTVSTKAPKTEIPESEQCFFDDVKLYKIVYPWDSKATK